MCRSTNWPETFATRHPSCCRCSSFLLSRHFLMSLVVQNRKTKMILLSNMLVCVVQPCGDAVSLLENVALISEGTTGLVTWEAALYLAEWALDHRQVFTGRYPKPLILHNVNQDLFDWCLCCFHHRDPVTETQFKHFSLGRFWSSAVVWAWPVSPFAVPAARRDLSSATVTPQSCRSWETTSSRTVSPSGRLLQPVWRSWTGRQWPKNRYNKWRSTLSSLQVRFQSNSLSVVY